MNMMVSAAAFTPSKAFASAIPDPIFAVIEAHKAAYIEVGRALSAENALEESLPRERRKSRVWGDEVNVVDGDAPEWVAALTAVGAAHDAEISISGDLISITPTSAQGVVALLQYVIEHEQRVGEWWPRDEYEDEEIIGRNGQPRCFSWSHFLCRNVLAGLTGQDGAVTQV
jgi:hypothetical protein